MLFQGIQPHFPEFPVMFEPTSGLAKGPRAQPAVVLAANDLTLEQARAFEDAQMLRDGGQGNIEWLGQLGNGGLASRKLREDGSASGVGEGAENGVEPNRGIVNHAV